MQDVVLHLGDCLSFMRTLEDGAVDAVVTDLPYGTTACAWDSVIPFAPMWDAVKRILKPRGVFVTTASQPFTSALVMSNLDWFKYTLVWQKTVSANFFNAKNKPLVKHEDICVFSGGTVANGSEQKSTYNPQGISRTMKEWRRPQKYGSAHKFDRESHSLSRIIEWSGYPGSVLDFANGNNDAEHPTQKPVALLEYLVRTYTNPGDTVLDFCFGSGTTGVACVRTGRNFIGCEISEQYFKIAQRRIAEAQLQPPLFPHEPQPQAQQLPLDTPHQS